MDVVVLIKMVPDAAQKVDADPESGQHRTASLHLIPFDSDVHALEEALLIKERTGASVTAVTTDLPGGDIALWTALAKGATNALMVTRGRPYETVSTGELSRIYSKLLATIPHDLVLTGAQAPDDVEGELGAMVASELRLPYVSVAVSVIPSEEAGSVEVTTELGGGLRSVYEAKLPVVVGMQTSQKPPRYAAFLQVRAAQRSHRVKNVPADPTPYERKVEVVAFRKPDVGKGAEMLSGTPEEIADRLSKLFVEQEVVGG